MIKEKIVCVKVWAKAQYILYSIIPGINAGVTIKLSCPPRLRSCLPDYIIPAFPNIKETR